MIIRRVQTEHKDLLTKLCLERDLNCHFYTIENEPQFLQMEVNTDSEQTTWFLAVAYGMAIVDQIHKEVYSQPADQKYLTDIVKNTKGY
jgi:hypothetical protein